MPEPVVKTAEMSPGQSEALKALATYFLGAGAIGAGGRALVGLGDQLKQPVLRKPLAPMVVDIPYRKKKYPLDEEAGLTPMQPKMAMEDPLGFWLGSKAQSGWDVPLAYPAMSMGVPTAMLGGWGLMDKIIKARQKTDLNDELEEVQDELRNTELTGHKPIELGKLAAACKAIANNQEPEDEAWKKVAQALDGLTKQAMPAAAPVGLTLLEKALPWNWPWLKDLDWGSAGGLYAMGAVPAGIWAGSLGHSYTRSQSPDFAKAQALKKQIEETQNSAPPKLYARFTPVDDDGNPIKEKKDHRARMFVRGLLGKQ